MKRILFPILLMILLSVQLKGQKKSDFEIIIPDIKIEGSIYNDLQYIEARPNPLDMGFVYINFWSGVQEATLSSSLESQLRSLIKALIYPESGTKKLAVQMRALQFDVGGGSKESNGMCKLRMSLYETDDDNKYYYLNTLDTIFMTGRDKVRESASNILTSFIADNLTYTAEEGEKALNIDEVMDIDFYEKNNIPFYTNDLLPDGVYNTYRSLKSLSPDIITDFDIIKQKGDVLKEVKIQDPGKPGKQKSLKAKEVYAIIIDGIPYISFDGNFHKAYKHEGDWRFIITQKVAGSGFSLGVGIGVGGRRSAGAVGLGIPIGGEKESIEIFIDQLNGEFIFGQRIQSKR